MPEKNPSELKDLGGKALRPGDTFAFYPAKVWSGPKLENGCVVYEVIDKQGGYFGVKHPRQGNIQRHPPGFGTFAKGKMVYVCCGVMFYPAAG